MSTYVNYQAVASRYDGTRIPVGLDLIRGVLGGLGQALDRLTLLDAGCGTGNYTRALVDLGCRVEAVDLNSGMLQVAQQKLAAEVAVGQVRFQEASIEDLPFDDGSIDAVVINQVLHHLEDESAEGFPRHARVFQEFARVLRPGGLLLINTCTREQVRLGYWYYDLIPEVVDRLALKYIEMEPLKQLLANCGLECLERYAPLEATLQGAAYFEPERILDPNWRDGDSTFALMDADRIEQMERRVRELIDAGRFEEYFAEQDRQRTRVGQSIFIIARRGE